jgi:hypothetical protein
MIALVVVSTLLLPMLMTNPVLTISILMYL